MESIPFLHEGRIFTIIYLEDLAFAEVRGILDELLALDAFSAEIQRTQGYYAINLEDASFNVWVHQLDVIIKRE